MNEQNVAAELQAMMAEQRDLMQRTSGGSVGPVAPEVKREQREMFVRHADRLKQLMDRYGWPTADLVGEQAARGAWLVAQHADTQLDVQRQAAQLLREAVAAGTASQRDLAYLQDRVAVNEGMFQVYGTQIADVVNGEPVPWPCVDFERLDERRVAVGIEPFALTPRATTRPFSAAQ